MLSLVINSCLVSGGGELRLVTLRSSVPFVSETACIGGFAPFGRCQNSREHHVCFRVGRLQS